MIYLMQQTPSLAELITSPEAAQILGCSTRTVHRHVEAGELQPVRRMSTGPNGAYLFDAAGVRAFAEAKSQRSQKRVSA